MAGSNRPVDAAVVAAVTAVLAAVLERAPESLRVRGIQHVGPAEPAGAAPAGPLPWSLAGRQAQMAARRLSLSRKESAGR